MLTDQYRERLEKYEAQAVGTELSYAVAWLVSQLRQAWAVADERLGALGIASREANELLTDRDHWRQQAERAEAELAKSGIMPS